MTNGSTEQVRVHIMMKEAVVGHQVSVKCIDKLLFEKLAQDDKGIWHMNKCQPPAARLRAVEVEFEKNQTRTKQSKVNSIWLKAAKNKMIKAFGSWVINTNMPFTVVDSVHTNPLIETILTVSRRDIWRLRTVMVEAEMEEMEETEVQMRWVLPILLDHQQITNRGRGVTLEDDRRSRRSLDEQPRELTQTYGRIRKGQRTSKAPGLPITSDKPLEMILSSWDIIGGSSSYEGGCVSSESTSVPSANVPLRLSQPNIEAD
ncbi:hypothetical protein Cgig2_002690 [Carnegiea gigantea]|uniref:Uncharacterized protein n=1 Tax=Carnegiea gigantea TaxID=171969 RepID=A0A9Q1JJQ3_9CARY|nr:hypothetical protein Cgig2_002690 [Carnegiea gigantea]